QYTAAPSLNIFTCPGINLDFSIGIWRDVQVKIHPKVIDGRPVLVSFRTTRLGAVPNIYDIDEFFLKLAVGRGQRDIDPGVGLGGGACREFQIVGRTENIQLSTGKCSSIEQLVIVQ